MQIFGTKFAEERDDSRVPSWAYYVVEKQIGEGWVRMGYTNDEKAAARMALALGSLTRARRVR